jgi:hypothetical protein
MSSTLTRRPVDWRQHVRNWRYQAAGARDPRIDLLRGAAVCAMIVDHVGGPSFLYVLAGANTFFVSPAEAFVFIAGLMVGIVYGERVVRQGLAAVAGHILRRAWTLYLLAVWLALGSAVLTTLGRLPEAPPAFASHPARFILEVLTLQRTVIYVDVLLVFLFSLALAPLALALLGRGRWWLVLLAAGGVWASAQLLPAARHLPWPIADNPVFLIATWQALFFAGVLVGHDRHWLGARLPGGGRRAVAATLLVGAGVALWGVMVFLHLRRESLDSGLAGLLAAWFDKSLLPVPRLAAFALLFGAAWLVVTHLWRPLRAGLGWLLVPLGQQALYAYAVHIVLVLLVHGVWGVGQGGSGNLWRVAGTLIQLGVILAVWWLTRAKFLTGFVRPLGGSPVVRWTIGGSRRPLWLPGPALAICLLLALVAGGLVVWAG